MAYIPESYLMHHGVKGQKWGVRRYQNYDGTLIHPKQKKTLSPEEKEARNKKIKKAVIIGAAVLGAAALAYGGYKYMSVSREATNYAKQQAGKYFANSLFLNQPDAAEIADLRDNYGASLTRLQNDYSNQRKKSIKYSGKNAAEVYSNAKSDYINSAKKGIKLESNTKAVQPVEESLKGWDPDTIEKLYNMRK